MTALEQYARLECPGLWRPEPGAQRRDVVVSFGEASLVISDGTGRPLSHWSLAAVVRANPGATPALYTPSAEASEVLEIADDTMVEAIERVRLAILRARPQRGRLRLVVSLALVLGLGAAGLAWLPEALVRHAMSVLPTPARAEIGARLFDAIGRVSGPPCQSPRGDRALDRLAERLLPGMAPGSLAVLPAAISGVVALPGGTLLVDRRLVEDHDGPDVLAGHVLAADLRRRQHDPLARLLSGAGTVAVLRLLTTGHLPQEALDTYAERLIGHAPAVPQTDALLARFAAAEVAVAPYAYALDVTGESVLDLIEGDPLRGQPSPPLLPDGDWVALQAICGT